MPISFGLLVTLAKVSRDKEAEKALTAYHSLTPMADEAHTIRVWVVGKSYRVGLTKR